jgi:hypothetical protein
MGDQATGKRGLKAPIWTGTNRVVATLCIWVIAAGLGGLVWLQSQHPFTGLPLTHPINLILLAVCLAIGLGYSAVIWLSPAEGSWRGAKPPGSLTDNQAFDDYAAKFGWDYDNGGWYRGLDWDRYASNAHCWNLLPDGTVHHTIVIMRRQRTTVAAVHFAGRQPTEIWSGDISTSAEFDRLLAIVTAYMAVHHIGA